MGPGSDSSRPSSASGRLRPGELLDGKYQLEEMLGRGGAGIVYGARDTESGRRVAIKMLIGHGLRSDQLERFKREGQIAAGLEHPGIVKVHTLETFPGGEVLRTLENPGRLCQGLACCADMLACGWEHIPSETFGIRLWSTRTWELLGDAPVGANVESLVFTPDGEAVYVGDQTGSLTRIEVRGERMLASRKLSSDTRVAEFLRLTAHERRISGTAFLDSGRRVLSISGGASREGEVTERMNDLRVWDGASLDLKGKFLPRATPYGAIDVSPDGRLFALALPEDGLFEVWSVEALAEE